MEFLVILCLLSNNPDSKAISEFSGMVASALSLKLNTIIGRCETLHSLPKDDDIKVVEECYVCF
jgi:hypothetical protein